MNVTAKDWQSSAGSTYRAYSLKEDRKSERSRSQHLQSSKDTDRLETSAVSLPDLDRLNPSSASKDSGSNFKMRTSGPDNSVGELAAMLSNAETIMDVQQVMSKAMRALAQLKMAAIGNEGKEAKKYAQQVKRMEKLIKRIQKKLKHLSKEQRLEEQRKKALKKAEEQKAKEIEEELKTRRKKRRRDERRYALKEVAEDRKSENSDLMSDMADSLSGTGSPDLSALTDMDGGLTGYGGMSASFSGAEGMSVDISV